MKCESWAAVGMGTDTSRIKGTLRLALQSQAIEWGWGSGRGNPSSLLHCRYGDGEREFHRSTGSSQTPEPRPWVSALLLQTWRSRFHCRFQNEYCFSSLCWLKPPKCSIFTFYITLIPNSIIFNNGLIQHFLQKRGGRTSPEHED